MLDNTPMQDQQYPPYHIPGRWYKVVLESDNTTISIVSSDFPDSEIYSPTGTALVLFSQGFQIVDYKLVMHVQGGTDTSVNFTPTFRIGSAKEQLIRIGTPTMYDYATVYVFGYYE